MTKPFKFRYVNEIVGGFVMLVIAALLAGVILAGLSQSWFEPKIELRVTFPPEGSAGITKGAEVIILGTLVGTVDEVLVDEAGNMEGVLIIQGRFARFIREDSLAVLKKKFGVAGDAFVEITKGSGPALKDRMLPSPARKDTELLEVAQDLLDQVQKAIMPLLEQVQKAAEEYTGLAADLRKPDGPVQKILKHLESVAAGLENGEGTAGKVLKDPTTINNVNTAITNLSITIEGVADTIGLVNERLRQVEGILADVKETTGTLPEALLQTEDTLREAEVLMEGIQKHWLLRKYVEDTVPSERIAPVEFTRPEGETP